MREHFDGYPLPMSEAGLDVEIRNVFEVLTGHSLDEDKSFHVPAFESRGMSSGRISPEFWKERAIPLLRARLLGQL